MANSKIPSVQITDTFNTQRGRFNQLVDSVGDVSTLTTTATDITNAIKEHDAELGTISAGAMGTTASTVSTAIAELDGRLDSINTVELLSPRMSLSDGNAVNTIAGKLEVSDSADFKDNLSVQGNLAVGGNTTMSGTLTVDGEVTFKAGTNSNINLGDANTDNVVFNADVNSNIIPNTDNAYDLGSSTQEWRHVYVDGTVNADNLAADSATIGTLTVTGDTTLNNTITVQDSAYITGDLDLGSNLDVAGNVNVIGTVVSEGALTVEDSAYITSNLDVGGNVTVAGNTTFVNTITVQDSAYITGNLDIGGNVTSTGTAFTIAAETGDSDNVSLGDTITFEAGEGINTTVSNNNIKIDGELATSSNKGVASFSTDNFLVSSGVVTIKDDGVALGTETTGNYIATIAGTTNEIEVSGSGSETAAVTIGLPDDVTIGQDLGVTRNLNVTGSFTVGGVTTFTGGTRFATSHAVMLDGVAINNVNRAGIAIDRPSTDSAVLQWNELGDYWEAGTTGGVNRLALQNDSATFSNIYQTGTGATRLPAGTTAQRPTARQGQVRYNTDLSAFEGYSGSNWGSLGGLIDVDQDTYIVAERVSSSDSDTLQFYAAGTKVATLNTSSFDIEEPINVNDTTQASGTTSGALIVDGGVGIAKNAHVGGTLDVTGIARLNKTTDATSSTSGGSLTVDGGAAIAKKLYIGDNLYVPDTKVIGTTKIDNDLVGGGYLRIHADSGVNGAPGMQFIAGSASAAAAPILFLTYGGQVDFMGASLFEVGNATNNLTIDPEGSGNRTLLYAKQAPDGENDTHIAFDNSDRIDVKAGMFDITSDSAYFSGDVNISGNLTVSGTTTTINTETLTLQDNIIVLNSNSANVPTEDAGLEVERGNSTNVLLKWDEGDDRWQFTNDGSTYYNIPISSEYNNFTYSLPQATSSVRGGIELFSNTTQSTGAESVTSTANRTYGIQLNSSGQAVVNVPWEDNDTVYSLPLSANGTRGGIQVGYSENGKNYPVELSSEKAFVNVPWSNTTYSAGTDLDLSGTTFSLESELNGVNTIMGPDNDNLDIASHAALRLYSGHNGTPQGYNSMLLHAANYQFSFGTDATNQFGIYEDTSLGGPRLTTTQANDNLAIDADGDIYIRPTGDNVYMRGTTSNEQLNFTLSSSYQYISASDTLVLEAAGDINIKPTGDDVFMQGTSSGEQIQFKLGTSYQQIKASDTLALRSTGFNTGAGRVTVESNDQHPGLRIGDITQTALTGTAYENMEISARYIACNMYDTSSGSSAFTGGRTSTSSITNGSGAMYFEHGDGSTGGWEFYVDATPFSSSSTIAQKFKIDTDGNITASGDVTAFSDVRIKDNIETIDGALGIVENLRGVYYTRTDVPDRAKDKRHVGVIAQEVNEVLPEVVNYREKEDKYTVDYGKMVGVLIEAMKEQQQQIEELKRKLQ